MVAGTVIVNEAEPVGVIMMGSGVDQPLGVVEVSVTGLLNPPMDVTVTVVVPEEPALIVNALGDAEIAKSAAGDAPKSVPMGLPIPVDKS